MKILWGIVGACVLLTGPVSAQYMRQYDVAALPATQPQLVAHYGDDALQYGELRLPAGKGPFPVAVIIHGGCWTSGFATLRYMAPLASTLSARGIATWNIEYRQVGDAGGAWPGTFADWAAGTDYLRVLARSEPLDLSRVVALGHSAGAHAALWLASRARLPRTSEIRGTDPLALDGAVAIDGPGDLASFLSIETGICGKPVLEALMGGTPAQQPARWAQADPAQRLPLGVPQALVASVVLQPVAAAQYRSHATKAGDRVTELDVRNGGHFDILAPGSPAFAAVEPFLVRFITSLPASAHT